MDPHQHVVARIHGIGTRGQIKHPERVPKTGRFEHLRPPVSTFAQRLAIRRRNARIEIVRDRRDRIDQLTARVRGRIARYQPPAIDEAATVVTVEPLRQIGELRAAKAIPRVVFARTIRLTLRKHDQRVMLLKGHRLGIGGRTAHNATWRIAHEREHGMHFSIPRERLRARRVQPASAHIHPISARLRTAQRFGHAIHVGQEQRTRIDRVHAVARAVHRKRRHHRTRKRLGGGALIGRVARWRAHAPVVAHHQNAIAAPLEPHHHTLASLCPIETACGKSRGECDLMQEVLVELRNRDVEHRAIARLVHADAQERCIGRLRQCRRRADGRKRRNTREQRTHGREAVTRASLKHEASRKRKMLEV